MKSMNKIRWLDLSRGPADGLVFCSRVVGPPGHADGSEEDAALCSAAKPCFAWHILPRALIRNLLNDFRMAMDELLASPEQDPN